MIRAIIAFLASVLTGVQSYLIYSQGKGFCFNSGCEIVESLTVVPPLYFNLAGFFFFQLIFWSFLWGRKGSELWTRLAKLLLMGGLMAEAVLLFFQHAIAQAFCSYCLIICAFIILLNLLCGLRQVFRGLVLMASVFIACFSLQFNLENSGAEPLENGAIAHVAGEEGRPTLHLFYSATCPHCEEVIEYLDGENVCEIYFNPIETIPSFNFSGAEIREQYNPSVNLGFLKNLSLKQVPVLVAVGGEGTEIKNGTANILKYLGKNCRQNVAIDYSSDYGASSEINYTEPAGFLNLQEEGCSVEEDCEDPQAGSSHSTSKY